jgi:hypothetical protein
MITVIQNFASPAQCQQVQSKVAWNRLLKPSSREEEQRVLQKQLSEYEQTPREKTKPAIHEVEAAAPDAENERKSVMKPSRHVLTAKGWVSFVPTSGVSYPHRG